MEDLTPLQIEQKLQTLPQKLWKLNQKVVEAHKKFLASEMIYEDALDKAYLQTKASHEDMTVREVEATASEVCRPLRLDMIVAQAEYEGARNAAECCDKAFSAMQSIVKLRSSEMRSGI
jgi:hypothetical protein